MQFSGTVQIEAPRDETWAFLTDPHKVSSCGPGVESVEVIDDATFKSEREVVKEERRLRVDNQPFGRLSEILYGNFYTVGPYKHTTIGSMIPRDL